MSSTRLIEQFTEKFNLDPPHCNCRFVQGTSPDCPVHGLSDIAEKKRIAIQERDEIELSSTNYVVGCFSRGRILGEFATVRLAKATLKLYNGLQRDGYAIYTVEEWKRGE